MMNLTTRSARQLVAAAALALAACGGGGGGAGLPGGGSVATGGTLRVHVTDAPFPFDYVESATVVIEEVRVHERTSDAWTTVFQGSSPIDLVPLHDGVAALLVEAAVPPGTYDQVRLIVNAGEVTLSDEAVVQGTSHTFTTEAGTLFFPSGAQTGIKMRIENDIVVTTQLSGDLLLDFDLTRNFVFNGPVTHAPGVRRVIFTPSVRATNASVAGSIGLRVMSDQLTPADPFDDVPISGATVRAFEAGADPTLDPPVATTSTSAEGTASFSLPPGTYDLTVEAADHEPGAVAGVVVVLANLTDVGDVLLAASGTISGTVMGDGATPADTTDDVVVVGATVLAHVAGTTTLAGSAVTGSSGEFQLTGLSAGNYDLVFQATGFTDLSVAGVAATLGGTGATYVMAALTANVGGTVTGTEGGAPVAGALVVAVNAAGAQAGSTTTAEDGTWSLVLPTGTYEITFSSGAASAVRSLGVVGATPPPSYVLDVTL